MMTPSRIPRGVHSVAISYIYRKSSIVRRFHLPILYRLNPGTPLFEMQRHPLTSLFNFNWVVIFWIFNFVGCMMMFTPIVNEAYISVQLLSPGSWRVEALLGGKS